MRGVVAAGTAGAFVAGAALTAPETRESIGWAWTFLITVLDEGPLGLWAVLVGMLLGWLAMAWCRALMPPPPTASPCLPEILQRRRMLIWTVGLVATVASTYAIWRNPWGVWLGVTMGLAAPWTWEGVLLVVGTFSPDYAAKLRGSPL